MILDCPPGANELGPQVLRAATLVIVPPPAGRRLRNTLTCGGLTLLWDGIEHKLAQIEHKSAIPA